MHPGRFEGATRDLGAPAGWDKDKDGPCGSLPIRDDSHGAYPAMVSAWFPTPEEIAHVVAGAPIHLTVIGAGHPPVSLGVGKVPE
jgi:hypothetical protein